MLALLKRYADRILGVLSCYDRVILWGTLPVVSHPAGLAKFFYDHDIPLTDLTQFAVRLRDQLDAHLRKLATTAGVQFEIIYTPRTMRKEARIQEILESRGDHPGLVHIFSVSEPGAVFDVRKKKETGIPYLLSRRGKCKHYYVYFIDPQFGLCHLRISSWLPFRLQFYCNGHSWLARQLQQQGIAFTQADNAFTACADWDRAQTLADGFSIRKLHAALDGWAKQYCPVFQALEQASYHWTITQAEYATDVVFRDPEALRPLYDHLRRQAILTVQAEDIATFVGRPLPRDPAEAGIGSSHRTTVEGTRVRHNWGHKLSLKLYDKFGVMLRLETTSNDVSFFQHHREVVHRNGTTSMKRAPMKKTIYSLPILAMCMSACNRRYLTYLMALSDPTPGVEVVESLGEPTQEHGRTYRGFNLFQRDDLALFLALARGEWALRGFANSNLRTLLPQWTSGQISRLLKRLRIQGLIQRMTRSYRYRLSEAGQRIVLAALRLRQEEAIPAAAQL